jgi:uncharacterized membrane protein (UPF0136 family)
MGALCVAGGLTGFARTKSMPSLVAGVRCVHVRAFVCIALTLLYSVGMLYLWAATRIRQGAPNGIEAALGARSLCPLRNLPLTPRT